MCIYITIVINAEKISVGFIFSISWGLARHFSKSKWQDDFFKNDPKLGENRAQLEEKFDVYFFLFRLIFRGISLIKLEQLSIFGENWFGLGFFF